MRSKTVDALQVGVLIFFLTAGSVTSELQEQLCLSDQIEYQTLLQCSGSLKIELLSVDYSVNNATCQGGCCVSENIICSQNQNVPQDALNECSNQQSCTLAGNDNIPRETITCPGEGSMPASFVTINYNCVEDIPEIITEPTMPTTPSTTTTAPIASSETTRRSSETEQTSQKAVNNEEQDGGNDDMGLVIGLSVAAGILIIVVVVVIAVFTTRNRRRNSSSNQSQNSTKTLASSDVEGGDSPELAQSTSDIYGFSKASETQQERLQKRNDNIKRNLSFKTEEAKNKRPPKLSKSKSKSKSSSIDQLNTNNSNKNKPKESQKASKQESTADKKTTPSESQTNPSSTDKLTI